MPQVNAAVVGVHNGTLVPTLNFFPNIIHPIEDLVPFSFKVLQITHKGEGSTKPQPPSERNRSNEKSVASSFELGMNVENGSTSRPTRSSTFRNIQKMVVNADRDKPRVPPQMLSPLNILSVLSFFLTMGLIIWAGIVQDGTAIVALGTISLASSIVGYASWWSPRLTKRISKAKVPAGDVIIRTREGAFLLVKCNEDVARELYTGTEECEYYCHTQRYRILVGFGTFLLMVSVVLLGNCNFTMQAAIGVTYICLNGAFWGSSLIKKDRFWDLSSYECIDITPADSKNAHVSADDPSEVEGQSSFTRTMWYAIRETHKIGWVKRGGVAPNTEEWDRWLKEAEENALNGNRNWNAIQRREALVGQAELTPAEASLKDTAEQHLPAYEIPPPEKR
jgi:hypothetical protein